jgi:LuxR family maltose regulon positive regulatory protein
MAAMTSVLLDARLTPPPWQPGSRSRVDLVERVLADERQVIVVTAPAGYGKSTFLRQWAEREERPVAWVSLEATDDDESIVVDYIANALERAGSMAASQVSRAPVDTRGALRTAALTQLAAALWGSSRPVVLMIDDVHQLHSQGSRDALGWLAEHLPPTARLALASRERPVLPLARLRAHGRLLEVGPQDLAVSIDGTRDLLQQAGVLVPDDQVAEIARRTEGWAAGVYMTALSLQAGGRSQLDDGAARFAPGSQDSTDTFVAEFLRTELLDDLSPEFSGFLVRTAPLDRFRAALCDHVLERTGSERILAELERSNAFLVPLDTRSDQYRYHHLFRQVLLAELRRRSPDEERLIQRRAAEWCAVHDDIDGAIEYAHLAGAGDLVASLLVEHGFRVYRAGRMATLDRWFSWFDTEQLARAPRLATMGAYLFAVAGRTGRSERWEDAILPGIDALDQPSRAAYAALRSVTGRLSFEDQMAEARIAMDGLLPGDSYRAGAFVAGGGHLLMQGEPAAADALLVRGIEYGLDEGAIPAITTALALRAQIALTGDDRDRARELVRRARELIVEHRLESYATSAAAFAVGSRVAVRDGDTTSASADIALVQRIRPTLTAAFPYVAARVRLDLAHTYLALSEVAGARLMLSEVVDLLAVRPGIAPMGAELAALRARAGGMGSGRAGVASLTTAELRLLGYLPSHLSFREIADRLFVSINTIKSQAISIYSKLGVSSRGGAIEAAVATGLLDASATRFPSLAPELDPVLVGAARRQA